MGMSVRVEGQPITLADLRSLVDQTLSWPADSEVVPRGSRIDTASITVEPARPLVESSDVATDDDTREERPTRGKN